MFRDPSNVPGDGVCSAQALAAAALEAIGKIRTASGSVTVMRADGEIVRVSVGDLVYRGDTIETEADGAVGITFADGTAFDLSAAARLVLNEFVCDPAGTPNSALFSLVQGAFSFVAGKIARTGGLRIDTPFATIRGTAQDRGIGILTLAALTFAAIKESQAASRHDAFLDDGTITYKDLPHGTFEIVTRDGRVIMADDPGETIVIDPTGSVARLPNSSSRMAELQQAQHSALATFSLGQEGGAAGGSSSPGFDIPVQLQPINFSQPRNDAPTEIVTINITPLNSGFIEILQPRTPPPPPPPPPTISLTAIAIANPNSAISIVNASAAHAGFPIVGITSEVEDGRTVTITIVNSANQVVYTGTTTVTNGSWLLEISSAAAKLIPDGNYTVIADVTNALGNTGHASKTVLIDTVAAALSPPDLIAASDSGSSSADKITNVTTPTVAGGGAEADATVTLYDTNGTVLGTAVADGSGHWSITSSPLSDGVHKLTATQFDLAGNASAISAALSITVDTVAAAPPGVLLAHDTGSSASDHITQSGALTISGIETGAFVEYSTDGGTHWSSSFTAVEGANTVQIRQTDVAGNISSATTFSFTLDTVNPTVAVDIVDASLNDGDNSSLVTFSFSEAVDASTVANLASGAGIAVTGGTLSALTWNAAHTFATATFTASDDSVTPGSVTVAAGSYTDVAGNLGSAGGPDTVPIDTSNLTVAVDIVDASLSDPDNSSLVTFSFSEAVGASTVANLASGAGITVTGGTLSALTWNAAHTFATATFTASDDSVTPGSVTVAAGSYTDVAGNLGSAGGPDTVPIDTRNPTVAVDIVDASLSDPDNSSLVTFSFSEAVGASTVANLASGAGITVTGGTLSALTWNAAHTFATATFTASDDSVTPGSVTVAAGSYTDVAGNLGSAGGPDTVPIDTRNPTVAVDIVDASLNDGDNSSLVTFSFSEAVGASTVANLASGAGITVTGGTLSALTWNAAHTFATATFTASDDSVTPGSVAVAAGSYTDVAGNLGSAGSDTVPIDTRNLTVAVDIVDASLNDGDNSSLVTFSFSEAVGASTVANLASGAGITVTGGTLSALTWNAAHTVATATFTASDDSVTPGSVTVAAGSYTDVAGNLGSAGSDTVPIDTRNPTVAVDIVDASLSDPDNSSLVTFSFSEAVGASTVANLASGAGITVTGGTLSALTWNAAHTFATATFTASDDSVTPGSVTVAAGSYTDVAGNLGSAGGPDTVPIDTRNPTVAVDIVDASLNDGDNSSLVTFSFSEAVGASTVANLASGAGITVTGGTLSALTWNAAHTFATATFTASDDSVTPGSVAVAAGSYTDVAGNLGSVGSDTIPIDTRNLTVAVDIVDASLSDPDNSSLVTFSFSEAVGASTVANLASGAGITVTGGTLSALTWNAAHTFATATFTASDDSVTPGSVAVAAGSYTDVAGNLGSAGSDTVPIDTRNPTVAVDIVDASLSDPDNSSLVTFSFSEAVGASTVANLASGAGITVTGGTLSALTWNAAHTFATATFTASDDSVTPGSVTVAAGSYTDVAGNLGSAGGPDTVPIDTRNPTVAVDIVDASLSDPDNSSLVTFSFSEAVGASTVANLASGAGITVTGGTLSALTWNAAHTFATATFTASDDSVTPGSVTVAAGSYTDVAGNLGSAGGPDTVPIDTRNPTVAVDIVDASLNDGDNSSLVTFSFSEAVGASTVANLASGAGITVTGGTLSALTWNAAHTFATATFTASDDSVTPGSVAVAAGSYTDVAGNLGSVGSDTVPIDTRNPTVAVDIVDASLSSTDNSSQVTFNFSEAPGASFTQEDITASHGTISNFAMVDATHYTATLTAEGAFLGAGSVSVAAGSYTDAAGNTGAAGSDTVTINTTADPNDFDSQATGGGLQGNTFFGTPVRDVILAINQAQFIYGGAGNDEISGGNSGTGETIWGGSGDDTINGNNGVDILYGGSGIDTIGGGEGGDTIIGGYGADKLTGGSGPDIFKYLSVTDSHGNPNGTISYDTISDFSPGNDDIDLTAFGAAFTFFKQGALARADSFVAAHTIAWFFDGNQTIVYANPTDGGLNGGSSSLLEIHLTGVSSVNQNDFLTTNTLNLIAPAGVAGEPINLGLTTPSAEDGTLVTVTIADAPSGWTLNGGTLLDDGTWMVQTSDPRALAITSPGDFAGALLLNVTETWTQSDGSPVTMTFADNVEVYPVGSPIFAWSGQDFLTGSSGKDLFVFSQPIGVDTIYSFDPSEDWIDLIGYAGFANFEDVQRHLAEDGAGNAVITLADGQSITLSGVPVSSLSASNFVFDHTPAMGNAGTMTIDDGAMLPLSGIITNTGTIALDSAGRETRLELIQDGITLQGGGQVVLSDSSENVISGTIPSVTLTNVDNTISGAGQIGEGQMTLVNSGTIIANGTHALIIDTGSNVVINSGTLEATGSGGLIVNSDIANSGLIWAYGGNITINGVVTGSGNALISGAATLEFAVASSVNVTFAGDNFGTLMLDNPIAYTGQIFGFTGTSPQNSDVIDLKGITFDADTSWVYYDNAGSNTGGTLTIFETINGTTTAVDSITFANGDYTTTDFNLTSDGHGGTLISDPPTSPTPDATVTSVVETTTPTATETAGSQTDVSAATVDGTMVARTTAVLEPDGDKTTNVTVNGNGAVAHTARIVSGPGSLMVNPGTAREFTSISHRVAGNPSDNRTVEVSNAPELGRTAPSRDRSAVNGLEGQIAIASVMLVLEYLTENFKLASDANAGTLIADPPASPDATVAAVADTRTVKAADTADTQATPVAADEGAVAAHDVAITPDGGMSDLTISGLPSDFALTENEGDEPTATHDAISLAYSEFTDHGQHGSGKDHTTAANVATTHSAEGQTAAKASVSMSSHTTSSETGSDGNSNGGDAARIHDAIAGHSSTIDTVGTTISDSVSSGLRGATSGHLNDQPHFENATPGTLQSLESPTQAALHADESRADHSHGAAAEHSPTIDTPATTIANSDVPGFRGEGHGHVNDQPQLGNADPGNNGLGHQSHELPNQAASHAAKDSPAVSAGEDAKGDHAAHTHGAAAKDSSTFDTPATTVAESDAPGLRGEPPGHGNDKSQLGNADPGNNGLGHQSHELPNQAASHAAKDSPAVSAGEDAKGDHAAHTHGAAAKNSSTFDTPATTVAESDAPGLRGEPPGHGNDKSQLGNADPGNNGLGHQSHELPNQTASHAAKDSPAVSAGEDAKGDHAAHTHGAAAKDSSTFDTPATTVAESDAPGLRGEPPGHGNDKSQLGNADPGNNGLGHQPSELSSQAAAAGDIPPVVAGEDAKGGHAAHTDGAAAKDSSTFDTPATTVAESDAAGVRGEPPGHGNDKSQLADADPGNNGLGHQSRESPSQASVQTAKDIPPVTAVENAKGDDAAHTHGAAAKDSSTIDTAGTAVAHTDSSGSQGAAAEDMSDQFHFANTNPGTSQSTELPSHADAQLAGEIPVSTTDNSAIGHADDFNAAALPNAVEDAKGSDMAQIRGAAAKDLSTTDVAGATVVGHNDSSSFQGALSGEMNDQFHFANANPGNNGLGQQSLELASQTTSHAAVDIPAATTELGQIVDDVLTQAAQAALDPGTTPDHNSQLPWTNTDQHNRSSDFITHA